MDWTELDKFRGIDLNDSFILGWCHEGQNVIFELEASIWPESEHYLPPKPNEYTCYRRATLSFKNVFEWTGLLSMESAPKATDATGGFDFGNIESLQVLSNGFSVEGDFGKVNIKGGNLEFEVHT